MCQFTHNTLTVSQYCITSAVEKVSLNNPVVYRYLWNCSGKGTSFTAGWIRCCSISGWHTVTEIVIIKFTLWKWMRRRWTNNTRDANLIATCYNTLTGIVVIKLLYSGIVKVNQDVQKVITERVRVWLSLKKHKLSKYSKKLNSNVIPLLKLLCTLQPNST
jgi:hypothetical protein